MVLNNSKKKKEDLEEKAEAALIDQMVDRMKGTD
jgi:hypothetical protein